MFLEKSPIETPRIGHRRTGPFRDLKFLIPFLKTEKYLALAAFLSLFLTAVAVILLTSCVRFLIDQNGESFFSSHLSQTLLFLGGSILLLSCASYGRSYLTFVLGEKVALKIRKDLFEKILRFPLTFFDQTPYASLSTALSEDLALIQILLGTTAAVAVRNLLLFLGCFALMLVTSLKLTALVLIMVGAILIPLLLWGKTMKKYTQKAQADNIQVGTTFLESLQAIRTIQGLTAEKTQTLLLKNQAERACESSVQRVARKSLLSSLVIFFLLSSLLAFLAFGILEVRSHNLSAGTLSAFLIYGALVTTSLGSFSEFYAELYKAAGACERLKALWDVESESSASSSSLPSQWVRIPSLSPKALIAFEGVSFAYPTRPEHLIFDAFTFSIQEGERVAIVGPSGVGKSTLISLLLKFYTPLEGEILFDGTPLSAYPTQDLRETFGFVSQQIDLFSTTLRENLLLGNPLSTPQSIEWAIKASNLQEVVAKLPQGLDTNIGSQGVQLSGGERQRVAIARTLLRNPRVLLLDEATNALDAANQQEIQSALQGLMKGRTTLIVTHQVEGLQVDRFLTLT